MIGLVRHEQDPTGARGHARDLAESGVNMDGAGHRGTADDVAGSVGLDVAGGVRDDVSSARGQDAGGRQERTDNLPAGLLGGHLGGRGLLGHYRGAAGTTGDSQGDRERQGR